MNGHTPGPWSGPSKPYDSVPWLHMYGPDGKSLWHNDRPKAEKMANHAMALAAPALLAALKRCVEVGAMLANEADGISSGKEPLPWLEAARAAIAKAEQP